MALRRLPLCRQDVKHIFTNKSSTNRLQLEVESFDTVIRQFASFSGDQDLSDGLLEHELSRANETVHKIQTFIEASLLRRNMPSSRRYLRNKGRATKLRE